MSREVESERVGQETWGSVGLCEFVCLSVYLSVYLMVLLSPLSGSSMHGTLRVACTVKQVRDRSGFGSEDGGGRMADGFPSVCIYTCCVYIPRNRG